VREDEVYSLLIKSMKNTMKNTMKKKRKTRGQSRQRQGLDRT
jgi:hypothetical protein